MATGNPNPNVVYNDLFFLSSNRVPSDMARLRGDLQCRICKRVFHKKFGRDRHEETAHGEDKPEMRVLKDIRILPIKQTKSKNK